MQLANYQIMNINAVLSTLMDTKLKGAFKFKLLKLKSEIEKAIEPIAKALEEVSDEEEKIEIINEEQDVNLPTLTEDELENLELSIKDLIHLKPIIKEND